MGRFTGKKCRLLSMLWLTGSFFFVELIVGYVTNSMALVADSFHMLSDVAALIIAFLSVKMSPKKWSKNTFGWARAEVLGALVNAVFLVALCFSITVEAVKRFIEIEIIHDAKLLVAVGTLGLILNIVGLFLFHVSNMGRFTGKKCRLLSMLWLTGSFFFVELIVGYVTNSMALVADSFHMLSDVAALIIAFLSVKMSPKKWSKNTFGWARAEVLGALVNAVFLVALCFSITVEAVKRFIEIEIIHDAKLLVAVGTLGLILNIVGLFLFHEHGSSHGHSHGVVPPPSNVRHLTEIVNSNAEMALGHNNATDTDETDEMVKTEKIPSKQAPCKSTQDPGHMNMKGVFLHVLSDALGSLIVVGSALIVWLTDWEYKYYIDPALSIVLVMLILASVWPLLRESALILLQTVPTHIQVDAIQRRLLEKVDGVLAVHEFHVWQLAGDRIIASAHIRCRNLSEYMKIAEKVKEFFHNEGIHSTTIQPEFVEVPLDGNEITSGASAEAPCALHCPPNDLCHNATCCGLNQQAQSTPSPAVTPYLCRQRTMGSRTESMNSNLGSNNQNGNTTRNLDALECGSLLPAPMADGRLAV